MSKLYGIREWINFWDEENRGRGFDGESRLNRERAHRERRIAGANRLLANYLGIKK
jgi:hypothetical protein